MKRTRFLRKAIPNFDIYQKKKQIEVISNLDWYLRGDRFDPENVLQKYSDKYGQALANGYDGIKSYSRFVLGTTEKNGRMLMILKYDIDKLIEINNMLIICTYSFKECSPNYITHILTSSSTWNY